MSKPIRPSTDHAALKKRLSIAEKAMQRDMRTFIRSRIRWTKLWNEYEAAKRGVKRV